MVMEQVKITGKLSAVLDDLIDATGEVNPIIRITIREIVMTILCIRSVVLAARNPPSTVYAIMMMALTIMAVM